MFGTIVKKESDSKMKKINIILFSIYCSVL